MIPDYPTDSPHRSTAAPTHEPVGAERLVSLFRCSGGDWARVVLVAGIPGSGKTDALMALKSHLGHGAAYLRLAEEDRNPRSFETRLKTAIAQSVVGRSGGWILLDDVHLADGSPTEHLLSTLLATVPDHVSVAVAGRRRISVADQRLRYRDSVVEIDDSDLAFTHLEMASSLGLSTESPEALALVAALVHRTGGWRGAAAMLRPVVHELMNAGSPSRYVDWPWADLVDANLVKVMSSETADLLPLLAYAGTMAVDELRAVVGPSGARAVIAELTALCVIGRASQTTGQLQLHPMLSDHVNRVLMVGERWQPAETIARFVRAQRLVEASALASRSGLDDDVVARAVEVWSAAIDHGEDAVVEDLLDGLQQPSPTAETERKEAAAALKDSRDALLPTFEPAIDRATAHPGAASADGPELARVRAAAADLWRGRLDAAEETVSQVLAGTVPELSLARLAGLSVLSVALYEQRRSDEAGRVAAQAAALARARWWLDHPDHGLAVLVAGAIANERRCLERGFVLCSFFGGEQAVYAGSVFLANPSSADSDLAALAQGQTAVLMDRLAHPGLLVLDRWRRLATSLPGQRLLAHQKMTTRQQEQLRYLSTDLSQRAIGLRMGVSMNTVKTNNRAIFHKLGVHSRTEAVAKARELGLL